MNTILELTNSKGRVVFAATQGDKLIDIKHECGGGLANKAEDVFLSASCAWCDNPSCKVSGSHAQAFIEYCAKNHYCMAIIPQFKQ